MNLKRNKMSKLLYERYREIGLLEHQIEGCEKLLDEVVLEFYNWMKSEDTPDNAERWFGYTNKDMLNEFKEQYED